MLNINQNFDLKAPVFNFDRDYFNSVEELEAYDTSNVPNHFVTNVAGMLYQFTDGKWYPMMNTITSYGNHYNINFGSGYSCLELEKGTDNNFYPCSFSLWSENEKSANLTPGYFSLRGKDGTNYFGIDATEMSAELTDENGKAISASITDEDPQVSLTSGDFSSKLSARNGLTVTTNDPFTTNVNGETIDIIHPDGIGTSCGYFGMVLYNQDYSERLRIGDIAVQDDNAIGLQLGRDYKSYIYRPLDESKGATITGVESITAFANPSATKVWATDGSTVDLSTKADTSDVLLKKSATGGYYIEKNSNRLGENAFAANYSCNPTGVCSHAEGGNTDAIGAYSHAEGGGTQAAGVYSHAQGSYNIRNINAIHSIGIGTPQIRKNSEFVYFKEDVDPKNGYKYLIGIGGYDGISTDNSTYKSVQEVIADLTARIEQLETKVNALEATNTPA